MNRYKLDYYLNISIVILTILSVGYYFVSGPDILGSTGVGCLKYYTTDSNILVAIASLLYLKHNKRKIEDKNYKVPRKIVLLKYIGTVAVTITLLTVFFFLVPMAVSRNGFQVIIKFFEKNIFFLHFFTPVLSLLSFLIFEKEYRLPIKDAIYGVSSVFVYSFIYLLMVVILKVWTDWYGFTFGGRLYIVPLVMIIMYSFTYLISYLILYIQNKTRS